MSKRLILKHESGESSSSKKGKSVADLRVSVSDQIQFKGEFFEVTVLLLDSFGKLNTSESNHVTLKKPTLCYKNSFDECDEKLELEKRWNSVLEKGRMTFRAKINTLTRDASNQDFKICIESEDRTILPCYSNPITVVSYKLHLLSEIPCKWYNQMGGGGNCITLEIECRDGQNQLIQKSIPLELILVYSDDGEIVRTQEILTKSEDSQMNTLNGKAIMKVRIEHVSRKHQNRLFAIKISPNIDQDPLSGNVSSTCSAPINVLSKITNRSSKDKNTSSSKYVTNGVGSLFDESSNETSSPSSSMFSNQDSASTLNGMIIATSNMKPENLTGGSIAPHPQPISDEDDTRHDMGNHGNVDTIPNHHHHHHPHPHSNNISNSNIPVVQALSNVLGWIDGTLKCLCDSKWQQVGYEQNHNMEPDYNKPLYQMTNPNDKIQIQLDAYRNKVMGSLSTVLEGIEPLLNEVQQHEPSSSPPPPPPPTHNFFQENHQQQDPPSTTTTNATNVDVCHPEPLSFCSSPCRQPDLARSGSNGIPGSVDFESLVNGDGQYDATGEQLLPLLRGLSRGFSDYSGQI